MKKEFKRWGLEKSRKIIAYCQLACGAGLLFGLELNILLIYSSIFLVIMMAVAVGVRVRSKDDISDVLPAIAYLVLGAIILYDATAHPLNSLDTAFKLLLIKSNEIILEINQKTIL